jgi:uncharacterized protein YjbJ (UPF0337 family)
VAGDVGHRRTAQPRGDVHLKNEGRVDHAKGSAKNAVDKVADTLTGRNRTKR